jgi:hypothetical protein
LYGVLKKFEQRCLQLFQNPIPFLLKAIAVHLPVFLQTKLAFFKRLVLQRGKDTYCILATAGGSLT